MKHLSIDGFAGGGGASCGLQMAGVDVTIAINHDPAAIRMHTVNHPKTLHLTEDIFQVELSKYLDPDDVVDVMWASPDCTSHSKANFAISSGIAAPKNAVQIPPTTVSGAST